MRSANIFAALTVLAGSAAAQNVTQLVEALQSLGLTSLANVSTTVASTSVGQSLLSSLFSGPHTVFAPNDNAWAGAHSNITDNSDLLAEVLSYHVVPGIFNTTATYPNTTVGRTLLNSSDLVFLEGNKRQVVAWADKNGTVEVLNQNTPCVVTNSTTIGNITLHVTGAVIDVPGSLEAALFANNLTLATAAFQQGGLLDTLNTQHGVTVFAPSDSAFSAIQQNISSVQSNTTLLSNVLRNHVINGTSVYSGELIGLGGSNVTTGAGEGLSARFNSTGGFVTVGNSTARIITPDIILWNGALHIIDAVLFDTTSDESAASDAVKSASAAATSPPSESGPIGFTPSPSGNGGALSNTASSAAMSAVDIPLARIGIMTSTALFGAIVGAVLTL